MRVWGGVLGFRIWFFLFSFLSILFVGNTINDFVVPRVIKFFWNFFV